MVGCCLLGLLAFFVCWLLIDSVFIFVVGFVSFMCYATTLITCLVASVVYGFADGLFRGV